MKRILLACAVLLSVPLFASGQSVADLQAQVEALLRQLSSLQNRLSDAETRITPPAQTIAPSTQPFISSERHRFCRAYFRDMRRGMTGDDVRALQEFLITEGMFAGEPTGYFGPITVESVKAWQARERIVASGSEATTGWGVFGPKTKQHFMQWCAGSGATANAALRASSETGLAPTNVSFFTNVSGFRPGIEHYVIDFGDGIIEHAAPCVAPADACVSPGINTHTYSKGGNYVVRLLRTTSPCPTDAACLASESSIELSSLVIRLTDTLGCTKEYRPVCGLQRVACDTESCSPVHASFSNRCLLDAAGASYLYEGMCRPQTANPADDSLCRTWFDGCNSCARDRVGGTGFCTEMACIAGYPVGSEPKPYCKSYFEIATSTTR